MKNTIRPGKLVLRGVATVLVLLVALIAATPHLLSTATARRAVLDRVNAAAPLALTIDDWQLRWTSGARIDGLHGVARDGSYDLRVDRVRADRSLLDWARAPRELGLFRVDGVRMRLLVRAPEPEPETPAPPAPHAAPAPPPSARPPTAATAPRPAAEPIALPDLRMQLDLTDAQVTLEQEDGTRLHVVQALDAQVDLNGPSGPVAFSLAATADTGAGALTLTGRLVRATGPSLLPGWELQLDKQVRTWELQPLTTWLARQMSIPVLEGRLSVTARVQTEAEQAEATFEAGAPSLTLGGGPLGTDRLTLRDLHAAARLRIDPEAFTLSEGVARSDLFDARAAGRIARDGDGHISAGGTADVARIVQALPATLRLQSDLRLDEGTLHFTAQVKREGEALRFVAQSTLSPLRGARAGEPLQWPHESTFGFVGSMTPTGLHADRIRFDTAFLQAQGEGDAAGGTLRLRADLAQATRDLGQLVNFQGWALAGSVDGTATVKRVVGMPADLAAHVLVTSLEARSGERVMAREPRVQANVTARIHEDTRRIETGALHLLAQPGTLSAELTRPFDPALPHDLGARVQATFELPALLRSLEGVVTPPADMTLEGALHVQADANLSDALQTVSATVRVDRATIRTPELALLEREALTLAVSMRRDPKAGTATLDPVSLTAGKIGFQGRARLQEKPAAGQADGVLTLDLALLAPLLETATAGGVQARGTGRAPVEVRWDSAVAPSGLVHAAGSVHVEAIDAYGVPIRNVEVPFLVSNQVYSVRLAAEVPPGRAAIAARFEGDRAGKPVTVEPGIVLTNVALTDAIADQLLARIHPLFARATIAAGSLNLVLDEGYWPTDPAHRNATRFAGRIELRDLQVGTTGLLAELLALARVKEGGVHAVSDQSIPFTCRDGRVETAPLRLRVEGTDIVLHGSMGLDRSLTYVADVPLSRELVGGDLFPHVEGQVLRVPIGGTVQRPRVDREGFAAALADVVRKAGQKRLQDELLRQLEKRRPAAEGATAPDAPVTPPATNVQQMLEREAGRRLQEFLNKSREPKP